jgi:hypothetical protein
MRAHVGAHHRFPVIMPGMLATSAAVAVLSWAARWRHASALDTEYASC